jgi:rRNA maturation endonuclease Nob1
MSKPTLDAFRRWLQVEIAETEALEPSRDRDKRLMHLSAALQEAMAFDVAYQMRVEVEVPPVKTERAVRLVSAPPEVQSSANQVGVCRHCEAELTEDLSFCAACGDFQ